MTHCRQIVYASTPSRALRDLELVELLERARAHNAQANVTGTLLYSGVSFIQVLEGPAPAVEKLLRKIRRDSRHRGFLILLDRVTAERSFAASTMDFERVPVSQLNDLAGYHDWSAEMPTRRRHEAALRLIEFFRPELSEH